MYVHFLSISCAFPFQVPMSFSLGSQKIVREAIVQDIRALMLLFQKKKTATFASFRQVWDSLDFSLIQYGCSDRVGRRVFMEYLYNTALSSFAFNEKVICLLLLMCKASWGFCIVCTCCTRHSLVLFLNIPFQ